MSIRVIAGAESAHAMLAHLAAYSREMYGTGYTYRTTTRTARQAGHIRAYLTITPREEHHR